MNGRTSSTLLLAAVCLGARLAAEDVRSAEISAEAILAHVRFLASKKLQGRPAGTELEAEAARYIAAQLEARGVGAPPDSERIVPFALPSSRESRNVYGWIEGSDEALAEELIVVGAHLDHLGQTFGGLHLGAEDNASGVAVLLEIAGALQARSQELKRTVVVAFFGAEEIGLEGSREFVRDGPAPAEAIVAMVNIDMIGRPLADQKALEPLKNLFRIDSANGIGVVGALQRPHFAEIVDAACAREGLQVFGTKNIPFVSNIVEGMAKNRGDHAPFERIGIPTLFFGSGESDDYHKPTDTVDKLLPELMARRARVIRDTIVALATVPQEKLPPRENVAIPAGRKVATLELRHGDLRVVLRDNSRSPAVLSGVQSLFHAATPEFDAFDPDALGASAGLNFEHIIAGHRNPANKFSPRHGRYDLYALEDERSATLIRRREDSPWDVSSSLTYKLAEPHAIDIDFRCTPHASDRFGRRGHVIFFFANYMNDVEEVPLHFRGIESADAPEAWIAADAPESHPDWNGGGTYRHRDAPPLGYDDELEFRLNSWSYDYPRYTQPFYYGRAAHGMVLILMFDRAHTSEDEIRFSLFKFKLPRAPRPAWDFQYVIHRVVEGREYGFRARLVWKKWVSADDCLAEYSSWAKSLESHDRDAASEAE